MAPSPITAKSKLSIPLYAVDFDPGDPSILVVGGGGGESRSGVGNKLILLKNHGDKTLDVLAEADLSRDEDSVTSLAVTNTNNEGVLGIIAGINSSSADQQAGKNEHLRSFKVTVPAEPSKSSDVIEELGRASLFTPSTAAKKETYQRILRLSPAKKGDPKRVAAIATGFAPEGEVIAFNFDGSDPTASPHRIKLKEGEEAADVDVIDTTDDDKFKLVYCTDRQVFLYQSGSASGSSKTSPRLVFEVPHPDVFESKQSRRTLRAVRFLAPHLVLLLANRPGRKGADLLIVRINDGLGDVLLERQLHSSFKAGTSLDVSNLAPTSAGPTQFVIAAAGIDSSIAVLTVDYHPAKGVSNFKVFTVLRSVHALQITKIGFSTLHSKSDSNPAHALRLASVSLGNSVTVNTFPLSQVSNGSRSRAVLQKSGGSSFISVGAFLSIVVLLLSILSFQVFSEVRGDRPAILGATDWLSPALQSRIAQINIGSSNPKTGIQQLLEKAAGAKGPAKAVVMRLPGQGEISADLHAKADLVKEETVKKWEELKPQERAWWKRKLSEAGHWASDEGDAVLKSVFFSEVAGLVGDAIRN